MFTETMGIGVKLANGLGLTILGMGVVFAILAILSFSLDILRICLASETERRPIPEEKETQTTLDDKDERKDHEEIIAIITAALAAHAATSPDGLAVKSIRRLPRSHPLWGLAGREHQMSDRL